MGCRRSALSADGRGSGMRGVRRAGVDVVGRAVRRRDVGGDHTRDGRPHEGAPPDPHSRPRCEPWTWRPPQVGQWYWFRGSERLQVAIPLTLRSRSGTGNRPCRSTSDPDRSGDGLGTEERRAEVGRPVLNAARSVAAASADGTFTPGEVVAECRRQRCGCADATIRTHVIAVMCVDAPQRRARVHADFERAAAGRYRFHVPRG